MPAAKQSETGAPGGVAVLIPAWQPDGTLSELVRELRRGGVGRVVVVDDGSDARCEPLFAALAAMAQVVVLRHERNRGKGRALKTGFAALLAMPELRGAVTADADGQHTAEDILRVARVLGTAPDRPVLGVRRFGQGVPLRSRVGNLVTRRVFRWLTGTMLSDTQTGLRGLPRKMLPELVALPGERYEYETAMLACLCRSGRVPAEVPIATVYLEGNRSSHFHPVWDTLRIYAVLLRVPFRHRRFGGPGK